MDTYLRGCTSQPRRRLPSDSVLQRGHPIGEKGFTKAGIRKLIARLNEELAVFEGGEEARSSPSS